MLQLIRDRATGWIAWVIVILICIPFALFGINQYFEADQGLVVATVDESEISYYQYRNAVQQQRARLQQMLGGNISPDLLDSPAMREQVLESLIDAESLMQGAVKTGLRVGDAQVASAIRTMPVFQESGQFSLERYNSLLRAQGMSSQGFEHDLRRSLLSNQVSAAFQRTAIVTDAEVDRVLRIRNEQRVIKQLSIASSQVKVDEPDEAAIKARYESNMAQYVEPEKLSIRYIELSRDDLAKTVTAEEDELRAIYEQRKEQGSFGLPEQREARHILIEVAADANDDQLAAARAAIDAARKRIADGEDFAAVAKEVSQDAGSAPIGGGLGQFGRGVMEAAFEDVAFELPVGTVSEPVRTRFGWHIIEVTAIQEAKVRSFEESRKDILADYQLRQAEEIFADKAEQLATLGFENPESLEVAAESVGLPIQSSGFFSLSGELAEGVAANPRVREVAFSPDVLDSGNNSELMEIQGERRVIFRVGERKPQRQKTLDEVRDQIIASLKFEAATKLARSLGSRLLEGLRNGETLEALLQKASTELVTANAEKPTVQWSEPKTLTREAPAGVHSEVATLAFRMPVPAADGKARYDAVELASGRYTIVELLEVSQAPSQLTAQETAARRERLVRELQNSRGNQALAAVQKVLRERANVIVNQQNLRPDEQG